VPEHQNADRKARRVGYQGPPPDRGVGRWAHIVCDCVDAWWAGTNDPVSSLTTLTTAPASANHGSNTAHTLCSTPAPSRSVAPTTRPENGLSRYVPVGRRLSATIPRSLPHRPRTYCVATMSFTADFDRSSGQRLRTGDTPDTCRSGPRMRYLSFRPQDDVSLVPSSSTSLLASGPSPCPGIAGPDDAERLPEGRALSPPGRIARVARAKGESDLDLSVHQGAHTRVASTSNSPLFPSPLGPTCRVGLLDHRTPDPARAGRHPHLTAQIDQTIG
jgi:hypothetical protein